MLAIHPWRLYLLFSRELNDWRTDAKICTRFNHVLITYTMLMLRWCTATSQNAVTMWKYMQFHRKIIFQLYRKATLAIVWGASWWLHSGGPACSWMNITVPSMKAALYRGRDNNDPCMQYTHAVCSKSLLFLPPNTHAPNASIRNIPPPPLLAVRTPWSYEEIWNIISTLQSALHEVVIYGDVHLWYRYMLQ